jgi:hypothetical protein
VSAVRLSTFVFGLVLAGSLVRSVVAQSAPPDEIVLWTSSLGEGAVHGDWRRLGDASAAGGSALQNPNRGRSKVVPALASPANYFEIAFSAKRATAYHLWIRMRAQDNSTANDSVHVQFSDSVTASGSPTLRIGTASSAEPVLQNGPQGATPRGWGWTDNGWGALGMPVYFAADGTHVVRVQQREDGAIIDQIVLSARTYASTPPGTRRDDTRIVPATGGGGTTAPSPSTIVIRPATASAGRMFGNWQLVTDSTAAGGRAVRNPNAGAAKIVPALPNPASYFEASFTASAGRAYHVWLRMRADGNSTANDSVHVQFSGSVTSGGSATARIGTTSSFEPVLQNGPSGAAPRGWGWTDNGWGRLGANIYFATTGTHTIRVQQREDGVTIDQIVISPDTFLTSSPGRRQDDATILPATSAPPTNLPPLVTLTSPAHGATFAALATVALTATASDPEGRLAKVDFYRGSTLLGTDTTAPFSYSWGSAAAGTYQLRAVATDADGASTSSATATITVGTSSGTTRRVAFTASVNHATVTRYLLEVFPSTSNPATATAIASSDLGRPTPGSNNEITVDRTAFLNGLSPGSYLITVASVGTGGSARSAAISFTR